MSTEGEKNAARNQLQRLTPEIVEGKFLEKIEREIAKREQQRKSLRVRELSFNSYYEFARQRIPQIIHEDSIQFPINDFAAILKPFYRGGALEYTLNNDMDGSLFDEQFIVFEIDKVRCGDTGDSGYHLFSYRQGGHHQQLRRVHAARPEQVQG